MKKMGVCWLAAAVCGVLVTMSGCISYHKGAGVDYLVRPESTDAVKYVTKYKVGTTRIVGQGHAKVVLGFLQFSDGKYCQLNTDPNLSVFSVIMDFFSPTQKAVGNAKNSALFNACEENRADQIIGATFDYTIRNYFIFATVDCSAKGFPATVEKVEVVDKQPVVLNSWQKLDYIPAHYKLPANAGAGNVSLMSGIK